MHFIFDRGCFHAMREEERTGFVVRAAESLSSGWLWLSMIGNADDPFPDEGPPKLSALEIAEAMEPAFEILHLESCMIESQAGTTAPILAVSFEETVTCTHQKRYF